MSNLHSQTQTASIQAVKDDNNTLRLNIKGRIDAYTAASLWRDSENVLSAAKPGNLIIDGGDISYLDASGIALFVNLKQIQDKTGGTFKVEKLSEDLQQLYNLFKSRDFSTPEAVSEVIEESFIERVGKQAYSAWEEIKVHIYFTGQITVGLIAALTRPSKIRWKEVFITSEKFGANALFIILLVNFLVGLVIAFQSAIPMRTYGADIFVANLVAIAYFKELGPLMTAFVVNGRSGSAFAAELGTMKVNEELDALNTMGLDPVPFLVIPKVIASLLMLPLLTIFGNLCGLLGGLAVMLSLGFTFTTFFHQVTSAATFGMILAGLFKTLFFAVIIAGVGCLAGMRASKGPSAVGDAATTAVVTGIILMILVDGLFGVLYYILGI